MRQFRLSIDIEAPPAHVWRALCDPAAVRRWDSAVVEALDAPPDYPRPGQRVRWRLRSGPFRTLLDRPQVVAPEKALRSLLTFGPLRLDETYTLAPRAAGCRLRLDVDLSVALPLLGGLGERLYLESVRRDFAASLAALKRHCESPSEDAPGSATERAFGVASKQTVTEDGWVHHK